MRLGILTSHPIQYQAPWFRALAGSLDLEVFFAHRQAAQEQADFGTAFEWDVDLLSGYPHRFLRNVSQRPGVNHFSGCDTPELATIIQRGGFTAFVVSGGAGVPPGGGAGAGAGRFAVAHAALPGETPVEGAFTPLAGAPVRRLPSGGGAQP